MNINKYPLIKIYTNEIEKTQSRGGDLALIFIVGATCELILREIMDIATNNTIGMERLIFSGLAKNIINQKQAVLFNDIREIRNKYIHIDVDKIINDYCYFLIKPNGLIENINEIILNNFSKKNLEKVVNIHISEDSLLAYKKFNQLIMILP
ncbi:MAG: hypothetical protein WA103_01375 [Minisyncoccales bacterium]